MGAPPEDGRANEAVLRLLAETLGRPRRDIAIVAGHATRNKVVTLAGIGPDELDRRLAAAASGEGADRR